MDLKELYDLVNSVNILEKYNLPYNFFTSPQKILTEELCLNQIIYILNSKKIEFPINDSSDLIEFTENKNINTMKNYYNDIEFEYNMSHIKPPYVKNTTNSFIILLCFIKAYASNTYSYNGCFKEYFKDVFNVFYNPLLDKN
jgi:hypothetical protein